MRAEEIHTRLKSFAGLPIVRFPEGGDPAKIRALSAGVDLSLGTLGDIGVKALPAGKSPAHLAILEGNHKFVRPEVAERLRRARPETEIDPREGDADEDEDEGVRYVAVAE